MSDPELRLDPAIRLWVFLPIVAITFLIGIIRHYVSVLLTSDKKVDLGKVRDSQVLLRSRALRENAKYLPKSSFLMRRHYMNNEETGLLKVNQAKPTQAPNPMTDPSMMTDMLKGDLKINIKLFRDAGTDFRRRNWLKFVLFLMLKISQRPKHEEYFFQTLCASQKVRNLLGRLKNFGSYLTFEWGTL